MKYLLLLLAVAVFGVAAQAQTASSSSSTDMSSAARTPAAQAAGNATASAAGQANPSATSASAAQGTNLSAELTKKVDTKNAKVGDEVAARTTSAARLSDGTKLPRGTRLQGKITDVQAKSADQKASRLAFTLDHAVMHDGSMIPIHATVMSLSSPAAVAANAEGDDAAMGGAGPVAVGGGGRASGGGGVLSGGGGVVRGATGTVGNATNGVVGATNNTVNTAANTTANAEAGTLQTVGSAASAGQMRGTNLPGVTFDSGASASNSAALSAQGKNIALASGTQMTLSISANQ